MLWALHAASGASAGGPASVAGASAAGAAAAEAAAASNASRGPAAQGGVACTSSSPPEPLLARSRGQGSSARGQGTANILPAGLTPLLELNLKGSREPGVAS